MTRPGRLTSVVATAAAISAAFAGLAASAPMHHLASGSSGAIGWSVDGTDTLSAGHVMYCVSITFTAGGPSPDSTCANAGPIDPPPASVPRQRRMLVPYGAIGFTGASPAICPGPSIWAGTVVSQAVTMTLTLSTGKTVHVKTIAPPSGLPRQIAFWVAQLPCGTTVTQLAARNGAGKVVAHMLTP
jgi:hypothetical protein